VKKRRWILVGAILALCLLCGGLAFAYLANNVPGVARLLHGAAREPTAIPVGAGGLTFYLPTATLTPVPSQPATAEPPSPTPAPSNTPQALQPAAPLVQETGTPAASTATPPPTQAPAAEPTRTAAPTPRPQWIAFESHRGASADYEILVMAPDGSRQTNLTNSWADDVAPAWAPDGRAIAFLSFRDTPAGKWNLGKGSLYAMAFDPGSGTAGRVWRITDDAGDDDWPSWSPDGTRIAFQSDRSGNQDIWLVNVDGSGLVQLTHDPADDLHPAWSPDGTRIAFTSTRSGDREIWVIDVQSALAGGTDAGVANLTNSPGTDRYPFWSPDGGRLTFNSERDGNPEIYLMNADGSLPRNLSQSPHSVEGLAAWSPGGEQLVFYSDLSGNKEIYLLDLSSPAWTNISNHPADDEFCGWSP